MSILTLAEAALIDPTVTQGRLDSFESFVRGRTRNTFTFGHGVHGLTIAPGAGDILSVSGALHDETVAFRTGDTALLTRSGISDGLYTVVSSSETGTDITVDLTGAPYRRGGRQNDGWLDLVSYPADVTEGVRRLIEYDVSMTGKDRNLKSLSVGRVTESYATTPLGTYPAELLTFLSTHERMSFGGTSKGGLPEFPPGYRSSGHHLHGYGLRDDLYGGWR